ncbi:MAG: Twitching motility protein PilT, partial [uncultured Gemmatimonadaceae bacterium]
GDRPLPGERVPAARHDRLRAACDPVPDAHAGGAPAPGGVRRHRAAAARAGARHGDHRVGQVDGARRDDPAHQREAARERDHDRGPDRVPAPRHQLPREPARGGHRHRELRAGAAARAAPGPGRGAHRRDPRPRHARHGAQGRRHRAPRLRDAPHHRRHADDQPRALVLPAAPAGRGPVRPLERAAGGGVAAARASRRQARARAGVRGARQHGRRARADPRHDEVAQHPRPDQGGHHAVRDAELRPVADGVVHQGRDLVRERAVLRDEPERVRPARAGGGRRERHVVGRLHPAVRGPL